MTNRPQLSQQTLAFLAMLEASQEEKDAAFYRILTDHIPQDMIDSIWQEIRQAGIFVASPASDGAEGAIIGGTNLCGHGVMAALCPKCTAPAGETDAEIADRLEQTYKACGDRWFKLAADRLRSPSPVAAEPVAWRWQKPFGDVGEWQITKEKPTNAFRMLEPLYASPSVRGDRE